jgi:hypothetical protein
MGRVTSATLKFQLHRIESSPLVASRNSILLVPIVTIEVPFAVRNRHVGVFLFGWNSLAGKTLTAAPLSMRKRTRMAGSRLLLSASLMSTGTSNTDKSSCMTSGGLSVCVGLPRPLDRFPTGVVASVVDEASYTGFRTGLHESRSDGDDGTAHWQNLPPLACC